MREFHTATGAKKNAVTPATALINTIRTIAHVDIRLAVWDPIGQTIHTLRVAP